MVRYWTKTLPVLTTSFKENSTYFDVSPSSRSAIDGFIGISGTNIFCEESYEKEVVECDFTKIGRYLCYIIYLS